jgi:hypothetical protein
MTSGVFQRPAGCEEESLPQVNQRLALAKSLVVLLGGISAAVFDSLPQSVGRYPVFVYCLG